MSWVDDESMADARALLGLRLAAGYTYGRWHNHRVRDLIQEVDRLRAEQSSSKSPSLEASAVCRVCGETHGRGS